MEHITGEINRLKKLCALNKIDINTDAESRFSLYLKLLLNWNKRTSLISKNDETRVIERHFFESILLLKLMESGTIRHMLDFGSGAGFPGLPVKIMQPGISAALLESKRMKSLFLEKVTEELDLTNIEILPVRGEILAQNPLYSNKFDVILGRAVYSIDKMLGFCLPLFNGKENSCMLFPKGSGLEDELEQAQKKYSEHLEINILKIEYLTYDEKMKTIAVVKIIPKSLSGE